MNERSEKISKLLSSQKSRAGYIKAKLSVLVPAQIRSLRLTSHNPPMPYQRDLAREAEMHQSRISMFETPGMSNMTLKTLAEVAAALRTGLVLKFVPFHEMLRWENEFNPDYNVTRLDEDREFIAGGNAAIATENQQRGNWDMLISVMEQWKSDPVQKAANSLNPESAAEKEQEDKKGSASAMGSRSLLDQQQRRSA